MPNIEKELNTIVKKIAALSRQVDKISKQVSKKNPAKTAVQKRRKAPGKKKAPGQKAALLNSVINVINKSKKGLSISALRQKTGLGPRQLSNVLYKLAKKGIIKTESRGVYIKG
jgi:predicted Rossmann fold nucleotide-binding protein DprA/Smf involved in DNA uptake